MKLSENPVRQTLLHVQQSRILSIFNGERTVTLRKFFGRRLAAVHLEGINAGLRSSGAQEGVNSRAVPPKVYISWGRTVFFPFRVVIMMFNIMAQYGEFSHIFFFYFD